jgi:uncharacterized protein YbcC (UPF0753/DUF2309 family)
MEHPQPGEAAHHSAAPGEALRHAIAHAAHLLPIQGPIATFVHHNTLHAFEEQPFHAALAAASRALEFDPYLSIDTFRAHYARGRIDDDDLRFALLELRADTHLQPSTEDLAPGLPLHLIERLALLHNIRSIPAQAMRWEMNEHGLCDDPTARALWSASLTVAHLTHPTPRPRHALSWIEAIGASVSHRDALLALTGEDPSLLSNEPLIRLSAAFLDEGSALWTMPQRVNGLFHAWLDLTLNTSRAPRPAWHRDTVAAAQRIRDKSMSSLDVIEDILQDLGVPAASYGDYISRVLLQLPGWAGMINRLERTDTDRLPGAPPASLHDFLALRLIYDRLALRHITAQPPLSFPRDQPLSALTSALQRLARAQNDGATPTSHDDHDLPWRLFNLARAADLSADALSRWTPAQAQAVADALDAFSDLDRASVWQEAYEQHYRRLLLSALSARRERGFTPLPDRPSLQAAFCIDDREESIRRHLEELYPTSETFGIAGFFGVACDYQGIDDGGAQALCPVVVTPAHTIHEAPVSPDQEAVALTRARRRRTWVRGTRMLHRLNRSLIFGPLLAPLAGLASLLPMLARVTMPRLSASVRRALADRMLPTPQTRLRHTHKGDSLSTPHGHARSLGFTIPEQAARVASTLENMGLTRNFAPLVIMMGHGSSSVNNPHMSAYDCGACGGKHGGPNARLFADMANSPEVRAALRARPVPIDIPDDCWFIGGFHNTASDGVDLFDLDAVPAPLQSALPAVRRAIDDARTMSAHERCRRFASAPRDPSPARALRHVEGRVEDLSQARPELGHVTNASCIVGRRTLTRDLFLDRRAFLVSYDPDIDPEGKILERILAAVGPVGAGINLEYYFSCVDNLRLGCGSKLPHNLTSLLGVMDGSLSDLRTGLPKQMIEIHEPVRLQVVVEAENQTLLDIVGRQAELARLIGNGWIQVIGLSPRDGAMSFFSPSQGGFVPWTWSPPHAISAAPSSVAWYQRKYDFLAPAIIEAHAGQQLRSAS